MASEVTVDTLIEMLRNDGSNGHEKIAYSRGDVADTSSTELLNKISEDMSDDEILKQAAHARVSGNIMADVILEKLASNLGPAMAQAVHEKIASILPAVVSEVVPHAVQLVLEKLAVGTSSAVSGNLSKSTYNDGSAEEVREKMDRAGKGYAGRTAKYWGAEETSGATVSGGGMSALEGGAGEKPEGWEPVHKLSAARSKVNQFMKEAVKEADSFLSRLENDSSVTVNAYRAAKEKAAAYVKEAEHNASEFLKEAELEADLARYQELEQKKAAGALTPEEEQEMEMIKQKLMAVAGAAQGEGAPTGAPGEGGPPPGGAMPGSHGDNGDYDGLNVTASEKRAAVKQLLSRYGLTRAA